MDIWERIKIKSFWGYCRNNRNYAVWIFGTAFLLYFFLGLCVTYPAPNTIYTFFGADNQRVYGDLTAIIFNHYRIKVHPLFLLLAQSPTLFLDGIINHAPMAVVLEEAFCGALSVSIFYSILKLRKVEESIRLLFTVIYGCSFSMAVFSSVPESFIFAGLGLISYWYFVTVALESDGPFSGKECMLAVFWGVVSFGITLTNYMSYLVGLVVLLACRYGTKDAAKNLFKINTANGIIVAVLCMFQKYIWEECPLFWTSIISWARGEGYEETLYMNWQAGVSKTVTWMKQIFLYPLLAPDLYAEKQDNGPACILFGSYPNSFFRVLLILFFLSAFGCIAVKMAGIFRISGKVERWHMLGMAAAFTGNVALHYVYGYTEAFMYTPHFFFLFLLLSAISLQCIKNKKVQNLIKTVLIVFAVFQIINNLLSFRKMIRLAETVFYPLHSVKGVLLFGAGGTAAYAFWKYTKWKKGDAQTFAVTADDKIGCICKCAGIYMALVMVVSLLIAFNYDMYVTGG